MKVSVLALAALFSIPVAVLAAEKKVKKAAPIAPVISESAPLKTSLFMYQPDAGVFQLTPNVGYSVLSATGTYDGASLKADDKSLATNVLGEFGVNDMLSVGVFLGYVDKKTTVSISGYDDDEQKASGLSDPHFVLNGRVATGPGTLRFGGQFDLSLSNAKIDKVASGKNTLSGFVGYEWQSEAAIFGGRLSYDLFSTDKTTEIDTGNAKTTGGKNFSVSTFYESDMSPLLIGAAAGVSVVETTSTTLNNRTSNSAGRTTLVLEAYGHYMLSEKLVILPRIGYVKYTAFDSSSFKAVDGVLALLGARYSF